MSDHSWVHIQIVTNIGLRLARLLFRRGVVPSLVTDHGLAERDAEVVIAAAALFPCRGGVLPPPPPFPRRRLVDPPPGPRAFLPVPPGRKAPAPARADLRRADA